MALGEVTNPSGTEKLHEYWVHGEGAAKIGWGTPGDFDRCVAHLGKYIRDPKGYCNLAHHAATGMWPAQHAAETKSAGRQEMPWHVAETAECPASKPYGVIKDADGSVAGCHPTREAAGKQLAALYANESSAGSHEMASSKKPYGNVEYADPKNGKYPIDTAAHAKAAWSYINMPANAAKYPLNGVTLASVKARIKAACKKFGIDISEGNSAPADGEYRTVSLPDMVTVTENGDGLTFEGYAAVFNTAARIAGWDEDFDEQIAPGAFRAVAAGAYPALMFEHGRHPLIGTMPLGRITGAREDATGLWIQARLTDNWLIQPVRDAVRDGAIDGMSFRFTVDDGGEYWDDRAGDMPLRTLTSVSVPELGPVVFPAYEPTTASVRSQLDKLEKLPVTGRPTAGARAADGREGGKPGNGPPPQPLSELYRGDGEALALRGIKGVRIA